MAQDRAFGIWTDQEIDWAAGSTAFKLGCTQTKLSSHLPPKWHGLFGFS
jgi:hypothetical protein